LRVGDGRLRFTQPNVGKMPSSTMPSLRSG
jgi:hypothetical protein